MRVEQANVMSLHRYVEWVRQVALPFWLARAADSSGVFYETLALDGVPEPNSQLRLRTGMRQAFVFAEAARWGLTDARVATQLAQAIVEQLRSIAWGANGRPGWAARFTRARKITDDRRNLYDHAFALLALSSLSRVTGDEKYLDWIAETMRVIDEDLAAPNGGWAESDRHELPRRQNPHMHLFEASLALFEATRNQQHLARAVEIFGLFRSRFFDAESGLLYEFFGPDWERSLRFRSDRLDPGHMAEWTWLLRRFSRIYDADVDGLCALLLARAQSLGLTPDGFLADEVDVKGKALVDRRRLWPQTEYLKALIVEAGYDNRTLNEAADFAGHLFANYLRRAPPGGWCDQFSLAGTPTARNIPASTLYHLLGPALEILRIDGVGCSRHLSGASFF
jgi:mannose/cellobiose epimerase-like protein (N-acyl-D-glucosamine 2-epimerase family)